MSQVFHGGTGPRMTRRLLTLGGLQLAVVGVLANRMVQLQVRDADAYRLLAEENRVSPRLLAPERGRILDRTGTVLAEGEPTWQVVATPEVAGDLPAVMDRLRVLVPLSPERVGEVLAEAERAPSFLPLTVAERLDWDAVARVTANAPVLPGVAVEMSLLRAYPFGPDLAHQVGYVGPVNDADLEADAGRNPLLRLPGFAVGKVGVERALDAELRGTAGEVRLEVNAAGRVMRELGRRDPVAGPDVQLTLDHRLQNYARLRLGGQSGAAVALDVATGDVLCCASAPTFDPNLFARRISSADYARLRDDERRPLADKSVQGAYPPGSTVKMSLAMAAAEAGTDPAETVWCGGSTEIAGRRFHCWKRGGHGRMNMTGALRESCDVFFYEMAQRVGIDGLHAMNARLGLGERLDLPLSAVSAGLNPSRAWKAAERGEDWLVGDTINASIGQGFMLATPMQLAVMTARLASGRAVLPRLLRSVAGAPAPAVVAPPVEVSRLALDLARAGMFEVVNHERGTAKASRTADPRFALAGKTGTSQVFSITAAERAAGVRSQDQLPWNRRDHALFVCFAPFEAPEIALAVVVEHGGGGSTVAAPIARDLALFWRHGGLPPLEAYPTSQRERIAAEQAALVPLLLPESAPTRRDRA
jgi:penicillin-binding protein 2